MVKNIYLTCAGCTGFFIDIIMLIKEINAAETWPVRQKVMWPEKPVEFIQIDGDDKAVHYGLYTGELLVSVVSCFTEKDTMQFRKFATVQEFQGKGFGTVLLNFVIQGAKIKGIKKIWCNARTDKKGFYEKFGLSDTKRGFITSGIAFSIMEIKF